MKPVTDALGVARSNIAERVKRCSPQARAADLQRRPELAAEIHLFGRSQTNLRRRADRSPEQARAAIPGDTPVNTKRVNRLMKKHGLLLALHTGRCWPREHDGHIVTLGSNIRWCSDCLEFTCWNGEVVGIAFALDCHHREVIGWLATTEGISGEMIRDLMAECVETRFAAPCAPRPVAVRQRIRVRPPPRPSTSPPP